MTYTMHVPTKLVFGVGSINELGKEARQLGEKAMVVTYPDIRRVGLLDRIISELESNGLEVIVFDKVQPNPRHSLSPFYRVADLAGQVADFTGIRNLRRN